MTIGTRSLLFGCHQVLIHPLFTLLGWVKLYGWRSLDFKMVIAIFVHDWGYWGKRDMDGPEGFWHPIFTFCWMQRLFLMFDIQYTKEITRHSRHLCSKLGVTPSRLCWADKMGVALMPAILWAILAYLTGEGWEYMENVHGHDYVEGEEMTLLGLRRFIIKYREIWKWRSRVEARMYIMPESS